jgi:hypothetical protein
MRHRRNRDKDRQAVTDNAEKQGIRKTKFLINVWAREGKSGGRVGKRQIKLSEQNRDGM